MNQVLQVKQMLAFIIECLLVYERGSIKGVKLGVGLMHFCKCLL